MDFSTSIIIGSSLVLGILFFGILEGSFMKLLTAGVFLAMVSAILYEHIWVDTVCLSVIGIIGLASPFHSIATKRPVGVLMGVSIWLYVFVRLMSLPYFHMVTLLSALCCLGLLVSLIQFKKYRGELSLYFLYSGTFVSLVWSWVSEINWESLSL
jgi:hypothetical protein